MLTYSNSSDTAVIILHEIYGINKHIEKVCEDFAEYGVDIMAPNFLQNQQPFTYSQESLAYSYFRDYIGFDSAFSQITEVLTHVRPNYRQIYVLGYSIGATVAWRCSGTGLCDAIIGFYGSRIRDYLFIEPRCPGLLIFPATEKSFPVDDLILSVNKFADIQVRQFIGNHGFADPFSKEYNKRSAGQACVETARFIRNIQRK